LEEIVFSAAEALKVLLLEGIETAMNHYQRKFKVEK
jgi:hypothetical protein